MSAAVGQVLVWVTIVVALWCAWRMRRNDGELFNCERCNDMFDNVDQWVEEGLRAELTQMDAAFDFGAGLADVYARADELKAGEVGPDAGVHPFLSR